VLTKRELAQFNTFGYVMLRATLTDAEVREIQDESLHRLEASYAHAPFEGSRRYWVSMNGPSPEIEAAARTGAAYTFRPHQALFDPHWVANPDNSPVRARWIQRLRALGFLDDVTLPIEPIELPHV
jgi:hypothetical protein